MKFIFTVAVLLNAFNAWACMCSSLPEFKSKEDLKAYDFIALVDIKGLSAKNQFGLHENGDIQINVIELMKGEVATAAVDPSFNSSCALGPKVGEQWLFFGRLNNGRIEVGSCDYTIRYRQINGMREWWSLYGVKQLDVLRAIYGKKSATGNRTTVLYPNGNIEIEQSFKNGKLSGTRKIYYPTGKLYITEQFIHGDRTGHRKSYLQGGQLQDDVEYHNGLIKKQTSYHFVSSGKPKHMSDMDINVLFDPEKYTDIIKQRLDSLRNAPRDVLSFKEYAANGRSFTNKFYSYNQKLRGYSYMDWDKQFYETKFFSEDGRLESRSAYDLKADMQVYESYDSNNNRKETVNKCRLCATIIFDSNKPPEATPEKVIIQ